MIKRFFLVLLAMLLVLSVFTACDDDDDDDDDDNSRAFTDLDDEILCAILDACNDATDDDYYTYSVSGTTVTFTFSTHTYTETSWIDYSDISVIIESGSTIEIEFNSSYTSPVITYNIDATVDGTSRFLYIRATYDEEEMESLISKIELDGVELTGYDALYLNKIILLALTLV